MHLGPKDHGGKSRLYNPTTGKYLHWSGEGEVSGTFYSWLGWSRQSDELEQVWRSAGRDWPYVLERATTEEKAA